MWFDKEKGGLIVDNPKDTPIAQWINTTLGSFQEDYKNKIKVEVSYLQNEISRVRKELSLIKKITIQKEYYLYKNQIDWVYGISENYWKSHEDLKKEGYEFQEYLKEFEAELWIKKGEKVCGK